MGSDITINMGLNNNPFVIMPLKKETDDGLKITTTDNKDFSDFMDRFDEIKAADKNKDNVISLNELKNYDCKTEFAKNLINTMEQMAKDHIFKG